MANVVHSDHNEQSDDNEIEHGQNVALWIINIQKVHKREHKKHAGSKFHQRVLPRYFAVTARTLAPQKKKAQDRNEFVPLQFFAARKTAGAPREGKAGVIA